MKTRYIILTSYFLLLQHFAYAQVILYTPKGSSYSGFTNTELTQNEINNINKIIANTYPSAITLSPATATYNCHSYAWNMTCGGPICWVNSGNNNANISINWTDGSYIETTADQAEKIHYYNGDHSAIVSATVTGMYESKWGAWPLLRHAPEYGPKDYNMSKRRYYKRNIPGTRFSGPSLLNKTGTTTISLVSALGTPHYYSWSSSPNLEIVSFSATNIIISPKSNGAGWIKINDHNRIFEFNTWYGTPMLSISGSNRVPNGQYARFEAKYDFTSSPTTFEWILNPLNGNSVYGVNTAFLDVAFYNAGNYQLVVRATNAHGIGEYCVSGVTVYNSTNSYSYQVYPNPAIDVLTVNLQPADNQPILLKSIPNDITYHIRLYNSLGCLARQTSTKGGQVQLDISNLLNGFYYLHIITAGNEKPEIHKIIIKH